MPDRLSRLARARLALLLLAASLGACDRPARPPLRGVVLVLLDTVRPDHLGCYGYGRDTSPRIDALAARGVRFEQAISAAPWTLPSVAALLSGRTPERAFRDTLQDSLVRDLQRAGVVTAAFTEGAFVSRRFGFDAGFEQWDEEEGPVQILETGQARDPARKRGAVATFGAASRWLEQQAGDGGPPFFLLVHTYEAHTPYTHARFAGGMLPGRLGNDYSMDDLDRVLTGEWDLTEDERRTLVALYDGDIAAADAALGGLLDTLSRTGLEQRTAVLVVSDHGEELGQHYPHNTGDHGHALLDSLVHVPLVLMDPRCQPARAVVPEQVRLLDVLPTVAELLHVAVDPAPLDGRSLLPLLDGRERTAAGADEEPRSGGTERLALLGQTKAGSLRIGLRSRGYKFILRVPSEGERPVLFPEPPERQLYDLRTDPQERHELSAELPALADEWEVILRRLRPGGSRAVALPPVESLDEQMMQRLRSLGYLR